MTRVVVENLMATAQGWPKCPPLVTEEGRALALGVLSKVPPSQEPSLKLPSLLPYPAYLVPHNSTGLGGRNFSSEDNLNHHSSDSFSQALTYPGVSSFGLPQGNTEHSLGEGRSLEKLGVAGWVLVWGGRDETAPQEGPGESCPSAHPNASFDQVISKDLSSLGFCLLHA